MTAYIAYCRVSTDRQGISGLGLEAQEATIRAHLRDGDRLVTPVMVEVETGRARTRPVLREAVARCRIMGATLIVAKLDRLARDAVFVRELRTSGIPIVFCNVPETAGAMGDFIFYQIASVAELEAGLISERTKAALKARKAWAEKAGELSGLGGDRGHRHTAEEARSYGAMGGQQRAANADRAAAAAAFMLDDLKARLGPDVSLQALSRAMNEAGARTPRGGSWTATAVKRALARAA